MSNKTPDKKDINGFYRVFIFSIACFWKTIFNPKFANESYLLSQRLKQPKLQEEVEAKTEAPEEQQDTLEAETIEDAVEESSVPVAEDTQAINVNGLQLLSLLQKSGRFVDFLKQDVTGFSNKEVGEAARVVHEGCAQVFSKYFEITPVSEEEEGSQITLEQGFDPAFFCLSGNIQNNAPYRGELVHPGWQVTSAQLPTLTQTDSLHVICPAEIEL